MKSATVDLDIPAGTRHAKSALLKFVHASGMESRIDLTVHWNFYMTGLGYFDPNWAHGINKGPLAVGYDAFRTSDIKTHASPYAHVQSFVTAVLHGADGKLHHGCGVLEQLMLGPYAPLRLAGVSDPAS